MLTLQPDQVSDWRMWAVGVAGAMVRAAGGAILVGLGKMGLSKEEPHQ